ncbi:hypothetical protein V8E55_009745 [Tylopilus felleus]
MSPYLRSSHRAQTPMRLPCKFPSCRHWFGNKAGLTQHIHQFHPSFLTNPLTSAGPNPAGQESDNSEANSGDLPPHVGMSGDSVNTQWHGPGAKLYCNHHPELTGRPCDVVGNVLADGSPPQPYSAKASDDWGPFRDHCEFELADLLYTQIQMSASNVTKLLYIFTVYLQKHGERPPFTSCEELYSVIDDVEVGDISWECFGVKYSGDQPDPPAPWMDDVYDVWMRDPETAISQIIGNTDFENLMDFVPYWEYNTETNTQCWRDFMSSDWAWEEVVRLYKTTVSVATGQHDYYPLYLSIGNLHNTTRHAHKNGVQLIAFLAMPKTTKEYAATPSFRKFCRQLFHRSLSKILERLRPFMSKWKLMKFADGYFQWVIYSLGPYIADYEEQVLLSCIVHNWCPKCMARNKDLDADALYRCQDHTNLLVEDINLGLLWDEYGIVGNLILFTHDFLHADIYILLAPDILHQLIKGTFKDHLVDWIEKFICGRDGSVFYRIAGVASFTSLQCFPQGRNFKHWTGNDSKALMKVYLPAIDGHVAPDMVRTVCAFLEFCYLVRRNTIDERTLVQIQDALDCFYQYRKIFLEMQVVTTFSLPCQHSMKHYIDMIRMFGAPNSLCSSITESKHIKAVKEPYRRSNRNQALGQMLLTNQHLGKLAAARSDFTARGMLNSHILVDQQDPLPLSENQETTSYEEDEGAAVPVDVDPTAVKAHVSLAQTLSNELGIPNLSTLISHFLLEQQQLADGPCNNPDDPNYPQYGRKIRVFNSASALFYAPSDVSGIHGMRREFIHSTPLWRNEAPRYNCVFINVNPDMEPMKGLEVVRVLSFFSFHFKDSYYPCAVVHWFDRVGNQPDEDTGMWLVRPQFNQQHQRGINVIHIDSIY